MKTQNAIYDLITSKLFVDNFPLIGTIHYFTSETNIDQFTIGVWHIKRKS